MGAAGITALAGSILVLQADKWALLHPSGLHGLLLGRRCMVDTVPHPSRVSVELRWPFDALVPSSAQVIDAW